jgi:hypothetical protein
VNLLPLCGEPLFTLLQPMLFGNDSCGLGGWSRTPDIFQRLRQNSANAAYAGLSFGRALHRAAPVSESDC